MHNFDPIITCVPATITELITSEHQELHINGFDYTSTASGTSGGGGVIVNGKGTSGTTGGGGEETNNTSDGGGGEGVDGTSDW